MMLFYLLFSVMCNIIFLLVILYLCWDREWWKKRYNDAIEELSPIEWDYMREGGCNNVNETRPED